MVAGPATAGDRYTQPTAGLFALLVIDTKAGIPSGDGSPYLNTSSDGGGGGGAAAGGASVRGAAAGGAAAGDAAAGGSAAGGAVGSGVQNPVAMSEKLADPRVLGAVPPGAVPRSPGPDTV